MSDQPPTVKNPVLQKLLKAKALSDAGQYTEKARLMNQLMLESPEDFTADVTKFYAGVTHKPTGFRIHVPRPVIPPGVLKDRAVISATPAQVKAAGWRRFCG